jgi:hypothetical protein
MANAASATAAPLEVGPLSEAKSTFEVSTFPFPNQNQAQICGSINPTEGHTALPTPLPALPPPEFSLAMPKGQTLTFTAAEVPPPPEIALSKPCAELRTMWEDSNGSNPCASRLKIRQVSIPVKYWKHLYDEILKPQRRKGIQTQSPSRWSELRHSWSRLEVKTQAPSLLPH